MANWWVRLAIAVVGLGFSAPAWAQRCTPDNTTVARVAAIDQAWVWNRYGAVQPHGMMFALTRDIWVADPAATDGVRAPNPGETLSAGKVALRPSKRPRPLVLRVNKGDCLEIVFTNLLDRNRRNQFVATRPEHAVCPPQPDGVPVGEGGCGDQPADRMAGLHVTGLAPDAAITSMAQHVGGNPSSLVAPDQTITYRLIAEEEGTFFAYSPAATVGSDGNGGAIHAGLFAAVTVEPKGSVWYRSQTTQAAMAKASNGTTPAGHPVFIDYSPFAMLAGRELIHSDLTAIIDVSKAEIAEDFLCLDSSGKPFPVCGDRTKPYREFTVIFHDESGAVQAFKEFDARDDAPVAERALARSLHSGRDGFAINYGTAGIGAEVLSNRKKVGPVKACVDCQMEEYFLSSWAVGDPAMIVDKPANMQIKGMPFEGQAAEKAYFPDDPSNVYHSYLNDRVVIRNLHAGPKEHHVFHLHAHQWLQVQANPRSPYLDSQTIGPGGGYTYEIAYGGSGNRNRTAGDSIFHCHFYPHFAQGMWALWRVHDVFEPGTRLDKDGRASIYARALPDGEIERGSPIPALVPLPGAVMAPMPGPVIIAGGQVSPGSIDPARYPGYPFHVPARAGGRPPAPPLDIAHDTNGNPIDGGLKRHIIVGGTTLPATFPATFPPSMVKDYVTLQPSYLPEDGTALEKAAMQFHAQNHASFRSDGSAATFFTNALQPVEGAPFAEPCTATKGMLTRRFQIGAFQYDMIINKKGWHTPQARILAFRDDILPTLSGERLPQPLFMRVNSGNCVVVEHTNVVPKKMKRDAFQLEVPTDIIGQHIHLVKFDVQASDGGANGFNYEDGTPAAEEVVARIIAIRAANGCGGSPTRGPGDTRVGTPSCPIAEPHPWFPGQSAWIGGQATIQRWYADPQEASDLASGQTFDKTLETVFTHDHFGASNHQQVGLYAGLIVEPSGTRWFDDLGRSSLSELGVRRDGGPTSWKALVVGNRKQDNFREFALEFQDFHIAFSKEDRFERQNDGSLVQVNGLNHPYQVADANPGDYIGSSLPRLVKHEWMPGNDCPAGTIPCAPELLSADDIGQMSINYRSEPLPPRLWDSAMGASATGVRGDLAHAFRSISRVDNDLNQPIPNYPLVGGVSRPSWPIPSPGMLTHDPFTPLLEVAEREPFRIRLLAGAHEHEHSFTINGLTWRASPHEPNSGFRSFIGTALSEHFEFNGVLDIPSSLTPREYRPKFSQLDHLYRIGASIEDVWYGNWGLIRTYREEARPPYLASLADAARLASYAEQASVSELDSEIAATAESGEQLVAADYQPVDAAYLKELIAQAGEVEAQLLGEARSLGLAVDVGALPETAAPDAARESAGEEDRVFDTAAATADAPRVGGEADSPEPAAFRTAAVGGSEAAAASEDASMDTPAIAEDGYYKSAVLEAQYEEMVETLHALRLDAASYLQDPSRQPGIPVERAGFSAKSLAPAALADSNSQAERFASLRLSLPRLVDLNDPQSLPVCAPRAPVRYYWIAAVDAKTVLTDGTLIYHRFRPGTVFANPARRTNDAWRAAHDPTGLMYVRVVDLDPRTGKLRKDRKIEPLILHGRAGECLSVMLTNAMRPSDLNSFANLPSPSWNINQLKTPEAVGIHAQTMRKHVGTNDGINAGRNPVQTVLPGQSRRYEWYAGVVNWENRRAPKFQPVEFGALNLMPADPVKQGGKGLFGALVIQPADARWGFDTTPPEPFSNGTVPLATRASAVVFSDSRKAFRDFVLVGQDDANLRLTGSRTAQSGTIPQQQEDGLAPSVKFPTNFDEPVRRVAQCVGAANDAIRTMCEVSDEEVDAVDAAHKAFNYRSEAGWMRRVHSAAMPRSVTILQRQHDLLSDAFNGINSRNQTPRFCALPGDPVRMRVLFPNGHGRNHVIEVAGHNWDDQPFVNYSTELGTDALSTFNGTRDTVGPGSNWNLLLTHGAGGSSRVAGDYQVRDLYSWGFDGGLWAVLRVNRRCQ